MPEAKQYTEAVPTFLRDKPKQFVEHCLKRLDCSIDSSSMTFQSAEECTVTSPDSGIVYTVTFIDKVPKCSCPDFENTHWPCKHVLNIIQSFPEYTWEQLKTRYTEQPQFTIDYSVVDIKLNEEIASSDFTNTEDQPDATTTSQVNDSARKKCIQYIANIKNSVYQIQNDDILESTVGMLNLLDEFLLDNIPRIGALPKRQSKAGKRKQRTLKKRTKRRKTSLSNDNQAPQLVIVEDTIYEVPEDHEEIGNSSV